ncbi:MULTISPECIES: hypothetical protein [Streptomyces]|uniref:hypothetical protein n=1 Tax=Streptomyces TaxID=1883 RepID=UPI0012FEA0C8|nr:MULTISPECIES: hypothetical protein [Streptomyces]
MVRAEFGRQIDLTEARVLLTGRPVRSDDAAAGDLGRLSCFCLRQARLLGGDQVLELPRAEKRLVLPVQDLRVVEAAQRGVRVVSVERRNARIGLNHGAVGSRLRGSRDKAYHRYHGSQGGSDSGTHRSQNCLNSSIEVNSRNGIRSFGFPAMNSLIISGGGVSRDFFSTDERRQGSVSNELQFGHYSIRNGASMAVL